MAGRAKVSLELDTFGFGVVQRKPAEEVRAAQLAVAVATMDDPSLTSDEEREGALRELLQLLGLYYRPVNRLQKVSACGTIAGYKGHIKGYQTPCDACVAARQAELDERWKALGIEEGEVVIPA